MSFNPNATALLGLEWPVKQAGGTRLTYRNSAAAARFVSASAETVTAISTYVKNVLGTPQLACDVYASSALPQSETTTAYRPNEDVSFPSTGLSGSPTNTVGSRYTNVDEATLDTSDYLLWVFTSTSNAEFTFRVGSAAGVGTDTIHVLRIKAVVAVTAGGHSLRVTPRLNIGGSVYAGTQRNVVAEDGVITITEEWTQNPATGAAWTNADIQAFDSTDEASLLVDGGVSGDQFKAYQLWVEVDHVAPPTATSSAVNVSAEGWVTFPLSSSWSKANATDYTVIFRKTNADGQAVIPALDSEATCPHVSHGSYRPTLITTGLISDLGTLLTAAHPVVLTVSGAASTDSQPYVTLNREAVYTGRSIQQELTPTATLTRGWVRVVVAKQAATADADLTVKLRKRSDDSQVGGTLTVTDDDLADSPRTLRAFSDTLASTGSLTSATQYYVELASTATSGAGWVVAVLDTETAPVSGDAATFGGTTDRATVAGTEASALDAPVAVGTVPAAPASFTATQHAGPPGYVTLAWTPTALGGNYGATRLYRDGQEIKRFTVEATATWNDYEVKQGVQHSYEIRVEHTNGTFSLPSTAATATVTAGEGWWLTSNQNTAINLEVFPILPLQFGFPIDRQQQRLYGRDYTAVFTGSDTRGDVVTLTVEVSTNGAATTKNRTMFDALLAVRDADVDYICVSDPYGRRWFASVDVDSGQPEGLLDVGSATLVITEVTATPSVA